MVEEAWLPNELLLLVKELIPESDLRTHVCYYNTCRATAAFYGDASQQASFWRRACLLSGIGWLKADSSWKEIAFETIARDGFCTHPYCGGELLDWNAQQVEYAMRQHNWDPDDGPWDAKFNLDYAPQWLASDRPAPCCSPVFRSVCFGKDAIPPWYTDPRDVYLRNDQEAPYVIRRTSLVEHPVAARSFATFPSVRSMWYEFAPQDVLSDVPRNVSSGVTVWDAVRAIQHGLDNELGLSELITLLKGPFACIFRDAKVSTNFVGDLEGFSSLRGLWAVTRCDGLYFVRSVGEGPIFSATFSLLSEEQSRRRAALDAIVVENLV